MNRTPNDGDPICMSTESRAAHPFARLLAVPRVQALGVSLQLAVVLWAIVVWFNLEGIAFKKLAILTWTGFVVHELLPHRFRLPFFTLLSVGSIVLLFGPAQGAWMLGIGASLIGLCLLPIRAVWRLSLVGAVVLTLCLQRGGLLPFPWSPAIWPVFGSMFMLRILIYVYDLEHKSAPGGWLRGLSYFFMLPNVCFPLFPVVDYQTFCRTHFDQKDRVRIYQSGIDWMVRGTLQLVLYRLVYQHLPIDTTDVTNPTMLLRNLAWPFMLYLQVSGLFHLVIGMVHLFGFNLPETHHLFYLASSYTDFWRRINIYWKDFMMKVFYYPAFFQLRKWGGTQALVLGTFWVFAATWFLHSYQWFWIRGSFLLKWSDTLFWTILAILVAVNVVHESKNPPQKRLGVKTIPFRQHLRVALQSAGVLASICVLWSLWISDSVVEWLALFDVLGRGKASDLKLIPMIALGLVGFCAIAIYYQSQKARPFSYWRHATQSMATMAVMFAVTAPDLSARLEPGLAENIRKLKSPGLNSRDSARRQRDYYEKLNDVSWDNPELAKVYVQRPADWGSIRYRDDLAVMSDSLPYLQLRPDASGRHRGAVVTFNRWGLRDRDCEHEKPTGVYRIAVVGASHTFGSGVAQAENFESLFESHLNDNPAPAGYQRIEVLNFAVEGYSAIDNLAYLDQKVLSFQPDAVLYVVHLLDAWSAVDRLAKVMETSPPRSYPGLIEFARAHGVTPGISETTALRRMREEKKSLLEWTYREMAARCRAHGVEPILACLPILSDHDMDLEAADVLGIARAAGFQTMDLSGVYDGYAPESLHLAPWDDHPNVQGHRLVADRLYEEFRRVDLPVWRTDGSGSDQGQGSNVHSEGVPAGGGS